MTSENHFDFGAFYNEYGEFLKILNCGRNLHAPLILEGQPEDDGIEPGDRMTDFLIKRTPVSAGQSVLDLGCGLGQPALRLARTTGCSVIGINVSRNQVEEANQLAQAEGMTDRLQFQYGDARELNFPDDTFDAVWIFSVMEHIPEPLTVMREVYRVLRSGGRFLMANIVRKNPLSEEETLFLKANMPVSLYSLTEYAELLEKAGFRVEEKVDFKGTTATWIQRDKEQIRKNHDLIVEKYSSEFVEEWHRMLDGMEAIFQEKLSYGLCVAES